MVETTGRKRTGGEWGQAGACFPLVVGFPLTRRIGEPARQVE